MPGDPIFYPASPLAIRDATFARVAAIPGIVKTFKARVLPRQDGDIPYASVWNAGDRTEPNGDANVGSPSFIHHLTVVVDVMVRSATEADAGDLAETLAETVRTTLLTDPSWLAYSEGVERCETRYAYPKDAESILVQAMIEIELMFRSDWPPFLPNDLKTIAVRTPPGVLDGFTIEFDNLDQ